MASQQVQQLTARACKGGCYDIVQLRGHTSNPAAKPLAVTRTVRDGSRFQVSMLLEPGTATAGSIRAELYATMLATVLNVIM